MKKIKLSKKPNFYIEPGVNFSESYNGSFLSAKILNENTICVKQDYFHECREEFHQSDFNQSKKLKTFLFTCRKNLLANLSKFIKIIETKLKIPAAQQTVLQSLNSGIVLVQLSNWWNDNSFRQQFFTILLRAGIHYKPTKTRSSSKKEEQINETLRQEEYFSATWPAVQLFLEGYNKQKHKTKTCYGWFDMFETNYYDTEETTKKQEIKHFKTLLKK